MRDLYNLQIGFRAAIYRLYRYSTPVRALKIEKHLARVATTTIIMLNASLSAGARCPGVRATPLHVFPFQASAEKGGIR